MTLPLTDTPSQGRLSTIAPATLPPPAELRRLPRRRAPAPPARRLRARAGDWARAHAVSLLLVAGLLLVAAAVLGIGITHYPSLSDDEGTYAAQAWSVRVDGALGHYTYWYDHPPLGWLQLALGTWLLGPLLHSGSAVGDARWLMLIPALVSAALVYLLARRLGLRRPFAAGAVLLFTLSPLAVSSLRMVYLDNLATPWVLAAFVLAASPQRRLSAYAASGACFACAVLTKETSLLLLPGLVVAVSQSVDRRTRAFCVTAFATLLVLAIAAYPLYALLKGELLPGPGHVSLLEAVRFQIYGRPSTGSPLVAGTLSRQLVSSWLSVDAWLLILGVLALPAAVWAPRLRPIAVALLTLVVMALRPGYLPQPYVIALLPLCALMAMGALDAAWGGGRASERRRAAVAVAMLAAVVGFAPGWYTDDGYAMRADQTRPALEANRWIARHVDHRARVLVDDTFYTDLVRAGFAPRYGAVWFYKLDFTTNLDPSIVRQLPQGWRAFDYVVSSEVIRSALVQSPASLAQVRSAVQHSTPVATFGTGSGRVEVRRIAGVGTGSGFLPRPAPKPAAAPPVAATPPAAAPVSAPRTKARATHHRRVRHHRKRARRGHR